MSDIKNIKPKKKNLFKFYKSDSFEKARIKLCAMHIILSYANELHEDINRLLQGYEGLYIGNLKHASKVATKAFEAYDKEYLSQISGDGGELTDANIDVTTVLDKTIENNSYYFHQGYEILKNTINTQIEERISYKKEDIEDFTESFEIISQNELDKLISETTKVVKRNVPEGIKDEYSLLKGVEIGIRTIVNWMNKEYLNA